MRPVLTTNYKVACSRCGTLYHYLPRCIGLNCTAAICPNCISPEPALCIECYDEAPRRARSARQIDPVTGCCICPTCSSVAAALDADKARRRQLRCRICGECSGCACCGRCVDQCDCVFAAQDGVGGCMKHHTEL